MTMHPEFAVGDRVEWVSSNTRKVGAVTHILPPEASPADLGIRAGGGGFGRAHQSYIVRGRKSNSRGEEYGPAANYWPAVSLLKSREA